MTGVPGLPPDELALSRATIGRADHRRTDEAWLARARKDPATRVLMVCGGQAHVTVGERGPELVLVAPDAVPTQAEAPNEWYLLGEDAGVAYFAADLPELPPPPVAGAEIAQLIAVGDELSARDAGLFVHAHAIATWHSAYPHCNRCGAATLPEAAGHLRRCPSCGAEHFPRTDPAVIMLVRDDEERALLGRQASWPKDRYSVLAGFVEPGESLEAAVVREVEEEAGIATRDVVYLGSQPWPFPRSLMLGFIARATTRDIRPDGTELADVRWFGREELAARLEAGTLRLPPRVSIARRLIEYWYGGPVPGPTGW